MKKMSLLMFAFAILLLFCACGVDAPSENKKPNASVPSTNISHPAEPISTTPFTTIEITSREAFSDDVAWIKYEDAGKSYYALINTSGNALVRFSAQYIFANSFSGGYSFVDNNENKTVYIFDTTGTVCSSYTRSFDDPKHIVCRDSGYYIIEENVSAFSSTGYKYIIYNPYGIAIESFQLEHKASITACGNGIFHFYKKGYYCTQGNVWYDASQLDSREGSPATFSDPNADAIIIGYDNLAGAYKLVALTPKGEVKTVRFDFGPPKNYHFSAVENNVCLYKDHMTNALYALHFDTGKVYQLDTFYSDRLAIDFPPTPCGNHVVIPMTGDDCTNYIIVTDLMLNPVCDPMQSTDLMPKIGNELLIFSAMGPNNKIVYTPSGKKVFSLTELGYDNESSYGLYQEQAYSCGYLLAWNRKTKKTTYLNSAGHELEIYVEYGKLLTFPKS